MNNTHGLALKVMAIGEYAVTICIQPVSISESESDSQLCTTESDILEEFITALVVFQVSIHQTDFTPVERVADAGSHLPGQIRITRTHTVEMPSRGGPICKSH